MLVVFAFPLPMISASYANTVSSRWTLQSGENQGLCGTDTDVDCATDGYHQETHSTMAPFQTAI